MARLEALPEPSAEGRRHGAARDLDDARRLLLAAQAKLDCPELRSLHRLGASTITSLDDLRAGLAGS